MRQVVVVVVDPVVGPLVPRRAREQVSLAEKRRAVAEHEAAVDWGEKTLVLRRWNAASTTMTAWRRQVEAADSGVVVRERPRLMREMKVELAKAQRRIAELEAQVAASQERAERLERGMEVLGKAHALLEELSESALPKSQDRDRVRRGSSFGM